MLNQISAFHLNKANLFFYTGEYAETIRFLNQVEFTDAFLATYAKIIQLKTYYAEKEYETLAYFITSFKLYIKRNNDLNASFKKSTDSFLNSFKKSMIYCMIMLCSAFIFLIRPLSRG